MDGLRGGAFGRGAEGGRGRRGGGGWWRGRDRRGRERGGWRGRSAIALLRRWGRGRVHPYRRVHGRRRRDPGVLSGAFRDQVLRARRGGVRPGREGAAERRPLGGARRGRLPGGHGAGRHVLHRSIRGVARDARRRARGPRTSTRGPSRCARVRSRGAVPQGYINGVQAAAACASAGKRLCTDAEWLRACQGPSSTTYPYGNTRSPASATTRARAPGDRVLRHRRDDWIWSELDNPCLNQLPACARPHAAPTPAASPPTASST